MRKLLISSLRNEGPHLLEWFAHHKRIGFTDFFIGQNDSDDYTREILQVLAEIGEITYHDNSHIWVRQPMRLVHQFQVNHAAAQTEAYKNADWAMMIDGDEFINIHTPFHTIDDLIEQSDPKADAIMLFWRYFGSAGHIEIPQGLVTENFTKCEPLEKFETQKNLYKTIFRTQNFARSGVHYPKHHIHNNPIIVDASGRKRKGDIHGDPAFNKVGAQKLATINHYRILDVTRFISKHLREQNGKRKKKLSLPYWKRADANQAEDFSLANQAHETKAIISDLDKRAEGALTELTTLSREFHKEQLEFALAHDPDAREVYEQVCNYIRRNHK